METNIEQCPLCGTELSGIKFREIQSKLREEEQRKATEIAQVEAATRQRLKEQFKLDLEKQKQAAEKKAKEEAEQEVKKVAAERDQANKKLKEAQEREAEIRKLAQQEVEKAKIAAEKKAKQEAESQIKKATDERDLITKKLKDAEEREVEIRKQAQQEIAKQKQAAEKNATAEAETKIKKVASERDQIAKKLKDSEREAEILKQAQQDAEKQRQKELADQRQTLEKDKTLALLKQQSASTREREALIKKMQILENQLKKKTANELGDGAEIDLFEALRESFSGDKITRIPKGQAGADILHEVLYKGEVCGRIIVDSKNRQSWQNAFVTKLRQDQVAASAEHAILATTVFPSGKKEMCIESGVIVMAPARVVYIAQLLRQAMVTMHVKGLSMKERTTKMSRLYKLITSESYAGKFTEANKLTQDILDLEVQEKTAHDNVWKKRGALVKRIHNVLREAETEVAAIIEGSDDGEAPPAFPAKSASDGAGSKETVAWTRH